VCAREILTFLMISVVLGGSSIMHQIGVLEKSSHPFGLIGEELTSINSASDQYLWRLQAIV
jgi:hypothetical protein